MKLDNEEQRTVLLQLLDSTSFPGAARKIIHALGEAIETAGIEIESTDEETRLRDKA